MWENGSVGELETGRYEWEGERLGEWECGNTCMRAELSTLLISLKYNN